MCVIGFFMKYHFERQAQTQMSVLRLSCLLLFPCPKTPLKRISDLDIRPRPWTPHTEPCRYLSLHDGDFILVSDNHAVKFWAGLSPLLASPASCGARDIERRRGCLINEMKNQSNHLVSPRINQASVTR